MRNVGETSRKFAGSPIFMEDPTCEVGGVSYSTYFECKLQEPRRPVGVEIVRGLYGVMERDRIDKGVIVTTSRFTRDAIKEAEMPNGRIKLVDYQELQRLMRK